MRSPTLLPAFSRHPVRPQLQLGLSEAAARAARFSGLLLQPSGIALDSTPEGAYISLAEAN